MKKFTDFDRVIAFLDKVDVRGDEDCWIWKAGKSNTGYGLFYEGKAHVGAHRYSYKIFNGPIPNGKLVLHKCDNPNCVNPKHLYLGSQSDNIIHASQKDRLYKGSRRVTIDPKDADAIRNLYADGVSTDDIVNTFGVSLSTLYRLIRQP